MKKSVVLIVAAGVIVALVIARQQMRTERTTEAEGESPVASESNITRDSADEPVLSLDANAQQLLALKVVTLAAARHTNEIKGYGRVLDPAPLSALVAELVAANATAGASQKELDRLKVLSAQQNTSDRALQTAEATAARDQASAAVDAQRLLVNWGTAIARRPDLQDFVQSLAAGETALVRITLPAGENLDSPPVGARLAPLAGEAVEGEFIGPAPTVDPQMQGQGFLLLTTNVESHLKPGAAMTGWLKLSGEPVAGVVVPEAAVVRYQEKAWVYAQTSGTNFMRTQVVLNHRFNGQDGWFVPEGLKPGDRIVVHGVESLLSEEQKSQIQLED